MPRVAGVDIPNEKPVWIALRYIHGIGPKIALNLMSRLSFPSKKKTSSPNEMVRYLMCESEVSGGISKMCFLNSEFLTPVQRAIPS